jgi:Leucine-rich repeat (LRR) protein
MTDLRHLQLRGASAVSDVTALAGLTHLNLLEMEGFARIPDTSPLANLTRLTDLELGGKWSVPRNGYVNSVAFLGSLQELRTLLIHTCVVEDLDYTPLLRLPRLSSVRVMSVRGMNPPQEELRRRLPGLAELPSRCRCGVVATTVLAPDVLQPA